MFIAVTAGARVPITRYTCTQPNRPLYTDQEQCTVSGGLWTCKTKEGTSLGSSITIGGTYRWYGNTNPFMVLDIPQGWCVGSVKMTFSPNPSRFPALSLSVHSAERLSNNTDRTFSIVFSAEDGKQVVLNLTTLACGRYLRINMTSTHHLSLSEFEVLGTSRYTFTDTRNFHDMLTTSLNLPSITDDSICTHPSSAGGNPVSPTSSVSSSTHPVTPIREYTMLMCTVSKAVNTHLTMRLTVTLVVVFRAVFAFCCPLSSCRHKCQLNHIWPQLNTIPVTQYSPQWQSCQPNHLSRLIYSFSHTYP